MAEENTVTMTVENVDQLFPEIVVNGEAHVSQNYVAPSPQPQTVTPVPQETQQESTPSAQAIQGQDVYAVELNDVLHNIVDRAVTQGLANEVQDRQDADTALQNNINAINDKIPAQASASNQLADKNFVNSSISTNTANFIGTFETVTDLRSYTGTVTNNDYAFVVNEVIQYNGGDFPDVTALNNYDKTTLTNGDYAWVVNAEDNTKYDLYRFDIVEQSWVLRNTKIDKSADVLNSFYNRYKATVSGSTVTWAYEYTLNNSSFTAEQWATINSGLTQESVDQDIADALASLGVTPQAIFDTSHPVGEVYVQYPAKKDPATLYNVSSSVVTVWTEITADYDGAFFRAYKNNTSGDFVAYGESLVNKMQASQNLSHNHSGNTSYSGSLSMSGGNHRHPMTVNFRDVSGSSYPYTVGSSDTRTNYTSYSGDLTVSGANHRHPISNDGGTEARPNNYAIKIWERTQ